MPSIQTPTATSYMKKLPSSGLKPPLVVVENKAGGGKKGLMVEPPEFAFPEPK